MRRQRANRWGALRPGGRLPPLVVAATAVAALAVATPPLTAQAALDRIAGLRVEGAGLEEALRQLGRTAGVAVVYSPDRIPASRTVACDCERLTVREALLRLLEGTGLTFRGSERQIWLIPAVSAPSADLTGVVTGVVLGSGGERISSARVRLDVVRHVYSEADGSFAFAGVGPGTYPLEVAALGWRTRALEGLAVEAGDTLRLTVVLEPEAISLAEIVVAPGRFGALEEISPEVAQALSREEIQTMPQLGEDVFRSMKRLPGVAAHDISTRLHIRGGEDREMLIRLDGLELYDPYHLKDWDGALGIVDLNALGGVELSVGGFGVEHGDRMTGVFDMRSRTSVGPPRTALGLSISNVTGIGRGGFSGDRGSWLVSARRGFMGLVIRLIGEDRRLSPQYWDVFGKVSYQAAPGNVVSAHLLHAGDSFGLHDLAGLDEVDVATSWTSSYGWLTWESILGKRMRSDVTIWSGRVVRDRAGFIADGGRIGMPERIRASDERSFAFSGARGELSVDLSDRALLKLGAEARRLAADFSYSASTWTAVLDPDGNPVLLPDSSEVALEPDGDQSAAWAAVRIRPWDPLTVELGVRHDRVTHTGDDDVAPRILAALDIDSATTVRGSWGRYFQAHGINELAIGDGEVDFHPAERAEQVAFGVERRLPSGITLRAEVYSRTVPDQRSRYLNLEQELEVFPEAEGDRLRIDPARGRARGLELVVEREHSGPWSWSASYTLAKAEDEVPDLFRASCETARACSNRLWIPRRFDQRHALTAHASYSPTPRWTLSIGWSYHSGWPATGWRHQVEQLESGRTFWTRQFEPVRELRLPAYHRLDLRATRVFPVRGNPLTAFIDLFNVYDRTNLAGYEFGGTFNQGTVIMERRNGQTLLPFLPTFGLRYEF